MKKSLLLIIFSLFFTLRFLAQQEAMFSQYMYSGLYINPAFSGSRTYGEINGIFRKQWVNFEGAPVTQILSMENPVKEKNMGWGAILVNDKIGVSCRTDFHLSYAYQIKTGNDYRLALGIRGGLSYCRAMLNDLRIWDANDQVFAANLKDVWLPNAGAGLYFYSTRFYSGISCPNLVDYSNRSIGFSSANSPKIIPHYYFSSGYVFGIGKDLNLKPSFLIKYVPFAPVQADLNLNAEIKSKLCLGISYRTNDGLVAIAQLLFSERWKMGYAYDYPLTKINQYSYGSHELMLSYRLINSSRSSLNAPSF